MSELNFKHLRYFWAVAHDGHLTRTAERLNVSQSALSVQIRKLEERLGHQLFDRRGRQLLLTEAGRIVLDHADTIFAVGDDLIGTLRQTGVARQAIRIGALATLSRNFQIDFLRPLLGRGDVEVVLRSGSLGELLGGLTSNSLDLVLTNQSPPADALSPFVTHRMSEQPVSLVGRPDQVAPNLGLAAWFAVRPLILPTIGTSARTGFDALLDRLRLRPQIAAEVDDMAMMRLLAREGAGLAVLPPIVVKDELAAGTLIELDRLPGITEQFVGVTIKRRFPNPLVAMLMT
jgi:LysR family transcriptional regulator, transcriptional activator of nhaA